MAVTTVAALVALWLLIKLRGKLPYSTPYQQQVNSPPYNRSPQRAGAVWGPEETSNLGMFMCVRSLSHQTGVYVQKLSLFLPPCRCAGKAAGGKYSSNFSIWSSLCYSFPFKLISSCLQKLDVLLQFLCSSLLCLNIFLGVSFLQSWCNLERNPALD